MFYEFCQNNSGGHFDVDDKLCHRLFIEADDEDQAVRKAESFGCYWNGVERDMDCDCCGDRWYQPYSSLNFPHKYFSMTKEDAEKIASLLEATPYELDKKKKHGDRNWGVEFKNVESFAQHLADEHGWTYPDARIFYKDGKTKDIFSKKVKEPKKK